MENITALKIRDLNDLNLILNKLNFPEENDFLKNYLYNFFIGNGNSMTIYIKGEIEKLEYYKYDYIHLKYNCDEIDAKVLTRKWKLEILENYEKR